MARLTLESVSKTYSSVTAVDDVSFEVEHGGFVVLVGPSGCGKSTLLKLIAGLEDVTAGQILIDDEPVNHLGPRERDIAMVFQSYALYPHLTVRKNIAYPLRVARVRGPELTQRVEETAELLQLTDLLDRRPAELSGGQRQRVAMGRAIIRRPRVFLMDEPLSNLDARLRVQMRAEITELQRELEVTTVYVTHDQVEAMTMGSQVAVLLDGQLQQMATPRELYDKPANRFVAGFMGSPPMNLLERDDAVVGYRPEDVKLVVSGGEHTLPATVRLVEELGAEEIVHLALDSGEDVVVRATGASRLTPGDTTHIRLDPARAHHFNPSTGLAL